MRIPVYLLILVGVIVSAGCQQYSIDVGGGPVHTSSPTITQETIKQNPLPEATKTINPEITKNPERVNPSEAITPVTGEVPADMLNSILKDLTQRSGVSPENITVIQAQEVIWNDGSLGCPQPGMMYTQSLVNGFQVVLDLNGQRFDYHAAESGYFFLCENQRPRIFPAGTPDS